MSKRRYYKGDPDKQPQDCGRRHPQPLCMCVLCEIAARFESIAKLQRSRDLLRAVREIDKQSGKARTPVDAGHPAGQLAGRWGVSKPVKPETLTPEMIRAFNTQLGAEMAQMQGTKGWNDRYMLRQDCAVALGIVRGQRGAKSAAKRRVADAINARTGAKP